MCSATGSGDGLIQDAGGALGQERSERWALLAAVFGSRVVAVVVVVVVVGVVVVGVVVVVVAAAVVVGTRG